MPTEETEQRLRTLEQRLKILEDIEEIKKLHTHYVNSLILIRWDEVMSCFAENSTLDVFPTGEQIKGKTEIERIFRTELSVGHVGKEGNFAVHPIITVDGDKAKGSWLLYMMFTEHRTGQWVQGYYDVDYVREDGEWKISYLKWRGRLGLVHTGSRDSKPPWVD